MLRCSLVLLILFCVSLKLMGFDRLVSIAHFSQLQPYVQTLIKAKGVKHVLLVFDDDGTLTAAPQDFGSVGWWNWQATLLEKHPNSPGLEAHSFKGLLTILGNAYSLEYMQLTSAKIPGFIHHWQKTGVTTMVSTARSAPFIAATLRQLKHVGLSFGRYAPQNAQGEAGYQRPIYPCHNHHMRPVLYQRGILLVGANAKGNTLQCLLNRLGDSTRYTGILLIDDTLKNDQVFVKQYRHLAKERHLDVYGVHYTKENAWQHHVATSHQAHIQMNLAWLRLKSTINRTFGEPNLPGH